MSRVLAGRYRLTRVIGQGGMGAVWEAEHVTLGTPVAVKLIKPELADGESARARFVREARSAANLRSPHVVQIFDYGVDEGSPYIAMELLRGQSLAKRLRADGRLSPEETLRVVSHVCRAVGKAHHAGIVHRDLKPDNVFIVDDEDGVRCKVLDFGVAKGLPGQTVDADTRSGTMLGTPYYMAPEQARDSSRADARADLWSVAVIAYECLVGERPFDGESIASVSVKILVDPVPIPSEHADVPKGFDAWFERATQRDPEKRFQSARELARELATALGLDVPTTSTVSPARVPPRRSSTIAWVGVAVFVAVLAAVAFQASDFGEPPAQAPAPSPPAPKPDAEPTLALDPDLDPDPDPDPDPAEPEPEPEPRAADEDGASEPDDTPARAKPGKKKKSRAKPVKPATNVDDLEF